MARIPDDIQDSGSSTSGGDDGSDSSDTSSDDQTTTQDPPDDIQDRAPGPGDSPSGGGDTSDGSDDGGSSGGDGGTTDPPDDIQDPGPGPGDSPSGGGDTSDGSDDGGSSGGNGGTTEPPDDVQDAGPGPGDSASGGGEIPDDTDSDDASSQPPEDIQTSDPANESESRSESGGAGSDIDDGVDESEPSQTGSSDQEERDPVSQAAATWLADNPEYDRDDVRTVDGEVRLTESGAEQRFAMESDTFSAGDVEADRQEDGGFQIELTESGRETYLESNYERGPRGAGEAISGKRGLTDAGSPNDPLEGEGLESGFGATADLARDLEQRVVDDNPDVAAGDVRIGSEDGSLTVESTIVPDGPGDSGDMPDTGRLDRGQGTDAQIEQDIDESQRIAEAQASQLQRGTGSSAQNQQQALEQRVSNALEEQGLDSGNFDIDVSRGDNGDLQASAEREEQFGDFTINVGGTTVEEELQGASEGYTQTVEGVTETLLAEDDGYLSNSATAEVVGLVTDEQTEENVEDTVVNFARGGLEGAAQIANVPAVALGAKEGAEYVGYAGSEIAKGNSGEVANQTAAAAVALGSQFQDQFNQSPGDVGGQIFGSLVGSTAAISSAGRASGRLGTATRYAIQPGEEIVTSTARRVPGAVSRGVDAGSSAARSVSQTARNSDFIGDTRGQAQLTRQRTSDSEVSEEAVDAEDWVEERTYRPEDTPDTDLRESTEFDEPNEVDTDAEVQNRDLREQDTMERAQQTVDAPEQDLRQTPDAQAADAAGEMASGGAEFATTRGTRPEWFESAGPAREVDSAATIEDARRVLGERGVEGFETQTRSLETSPEAVVRGAAYATETAQSTTLDAAQDVTVGQQTQRTTSQTIGLETQATATEALTETTVTDTTLATEARTDTAVETTVDTTLDTRQDYGTDTAVDTTLDTRQDYGTDTAVDTRMDQRAVETELTAETETRRETEFDLEGTGAGDTIDFGDEQAGDEQRFQYESLDLS